MWSAARPMQGAVFLPTGSMRMFSAGISGSWRISSAAWLLPVTMRVRSGGTRGRIRSTVWRMIDR
jgi:hypothetical protein